MHDHKLANNKDLSIWLNHGNINELIALFKIEIYSFEKKCNVLIVEQQ